jgi:hypothetical protein
MALCTQINLSVLLNGQVLHLLVQASGTSCTLILSSRLRILPDEDASLTTHADHCTLVRSHCHACTAAHKADEYMFGV